MAARGVAAAYSATGGAWQAGPGRIYDRLAEVVVGLSPVPLPGRTLLDVGAGTGAASRAIVRAGGRAIAVDPAIGMLAFDRLVRPPAVGGDAVRLPFRSRSVDGVVAAFSYNHVADPVAAIAEAVRVTRPGGPIVASAYADDDAHPVKDAVAGALRRRGWQEPSWNAHAGARAIVKLATAERCAEVARAAGLPAEVHARRVPFTDLEAADLVAWRLGMAQTAPFVARLAHHQRTEVAAEAIQRLGDDWPPLVRSILVITAVA